MVLAGLEIPELMLVLESVLFLELALVLRLVLLLELMLVLESGKALEERQMFQVSSKVQEMVKRRQFLAFQPLYLLQVPEL